MKSFVPALAITLGLSVSTAQAAIISSAGDPSLAGGSVITFDDTGNQMFTSLTQQNVTFSGDGQLRVDNAYAGSYNTRGTGYIDNNAGSTSAIRFSFSDSISAFGFMWGASNVAWTLSAFDGGDLQIESYFLPVTAGGNDGDFVGLSGVGIAYATLTNNSGDWVFIDNFTTVAAPTDVPEPVSLILLGTGVIGMAMARRRPSR